MIITAILVYAFLFKGMAIPTISFVFAALFDLTMAEALFG